MAAKTARRRARSKPEYVAQVAQRLSEAQDAWLDDVTDPRARAHYEAVKSTWDTVKGMI